jgi:GAF domain-containing protein/HAMP domain-containing protein
MQNPILIGILGLAAALVLLLGLFIARQFANFSLRTKLILAFLLVALIPLAILGVVNVNTTRTALTDAANLSLTAAASQTAAKLDTFINTNLDAIRTEAQTPALARYLNLPPDQRSGSPEEAEVTAILRALSRKDQLYILSYALLTDQGLNVLDTHTPDIGLDVAGRNYFQEPLRTGLPYVSPVQFSPTTPDLAELYFSSPVRNNLGETVGVLRLRYSATVLQQFIVQSTGLAGTGSVAILLDEHHIRLADALAPELIFKSVVPLDPGEVVTLKAAGRLPDLPPAELSTNLPDFEQGLHRVTSEQPNFTGTAHPGAALEQVAVASLTTRAWSVVVAQPHSGFLAPLEAQTRATLFLALIITGLVAGVAIGMSQLLAAPIIRLTGVAQRVAGGDLTIQAPVRARDETGRLAEAFNTMTAQLRSFIASLEDQVRERTAELTLSMGVGQRASAIRDLAELLPTITEFVREQFSLYYTHVYFVDDIGEKLVIKAGTGMVGQELMARGHSLLVGPGSIVGQVAATGQSIIVPDTETSDIHKPNPLLPDTRSELAVPLIVEGRVMGVLDMQADQANTFTEQNLTVFEAMATQLAISIDSAQQWVSAQAAQRRAEEALRRLTREAWAERLAPMEKGLGFAYDLSEVTTLEVEAPGGVEPQNGGLAVPVVVQNEPIGQLSVEISADKKWDEDEQTLLRAVAQQLAQKAENLRLFEQTQRRAAREQMARQITDKVRASRNIESALKTAAEELSKALSTARAVVDLNVTPPAADAGDPTPGPEEEQSRAEDAEK